MLGRRRILAAALAVVAPSGCCIRPAGAFSSANAAASSGGPAASPGRTRPLVLVTRSLALEWPPLGLGVRALAALSGRGLSGWAGPIGWERARCPAANVRLASPRRTPNPGCDGWGRSARLIPSPRRRGSRRYGIPRASAHRRCNPALLDERKLRLSAAGAPARHQGSLSQQMGQALPIALLVHDDAG
jgi:hypothetical protein